MQNNWFEKQSHGKLVFFLILAGYVFLMFGNNIVSLTHPDEVFYTQTSKEMVEHNSWFVPLIFDQPQFEKPLFFYLITAVGFKLFGVTPFMARFFPSLFGIFGLVSVYYISWFMFRKKRLSFFAGVILGTSFIYLALSRAVLTDMVFSVLILIALTFFYCWHSSGRKLLPLLGFYGFTGLAVLTKGLLGLLFPMTAVFLFLFFIKDLKVLKDKNHWIGMGLFLLVALPWHVAMLVKFGNFFIEEYWSNVHVRRLFQAEHPKLNSIFFYPVLMFAGVLPWTLYLFPAIGHLIKTIRRNEAGKNALIFILCWIFSVYIFVAPAASKLASYIFPLFPAIVIIIAFYLEDVVSRPKAVFGLRVVGGLMSLVLFVGAVVGSIIARQYPDVIVDMMPIYLAVVLLMTTSFLIGLFSMKRDMFRMFAAHTGVTLTLLVGLLFSRPDIEIWVSCKDAVEMFHKLGDKSESTILASKFYVRGVRYYTQRDMAVIAPSDKGFWSPHPIPFLNTDEKIIEFLNSQPFTYAIVKESDVDHLKRIAPGRGFRIQDFGGVGGKYILKIEKNQIESAG